MINAEMSSRKGAGYPSSAVTSDPSDKGKGAADISSDMNVSHTEDDGWEEYGRKSKNKNKNNSSRQRVPQQSTSNAWGRTDTVQKLGLRDGGDSGRGLSQNGGRGYVSSNRNPNSGYVAAAPPVIPPPLKNGWGWSTRTAATSQHSDSAAYNQSSKGDEVDEDDQESDDIDDSDDELLSDDFDSDASQKSHETRKKNKWFEEIFQCLDKLTPEQINEPEREWHCPACKGGPGSIDWYRGLQPLIAHAKTKRSKRMKLHRELAQLLEEELRIRGTSAVPAGEVFGIWEGLDERADKLIVWPPMVIVLNTWHVKDDNDKWLGMGNQELLEYFSDYSPEKARNSYGPKGHRGLSLLIFEASAVGYAEAERLSKHFEDDNRGRIAWDRIAWHGNKVPYYSGGRRQLYGYMAEKDDMEHFNQHSQGKSKMKYEMRSYQEMVVKQMKQMSEDNQQLEWLKSKVVKEQMSKKALEQSFGVLSEKLRNTMIENKEVKLRTKRHHEQNKAEMDSQEKFYGEQIQLLYDARNAKEEKFEKMQQHKLEKVKGNVSVSSAEERGGRVEEIGKHIEHEEEMQEFVMKRDQLMRGHEERKLELKRRHWVEEMALEEEFNEEFNKLLEEYSPAESKHTFIQTDQYKG